jgi:hypothetical protein
MGFDHSEDRTLVACPTYSGLDYALDEYLAAYDAMVWPERGLMMVDNTRDDGEYARSIQRRFEGPRRHLRHVDPFPTWEATFKRCWDMIAAHAHFNGYRWVLSLEADVIVPPLALDALLNVAAVTNAPFVTHLYPFHNGRPVMYEGLGCTLMHLDFLDYALEVRYRTVPAVEGAVYASAQSTSRVTLRDLFDVRHLDPPPGTAKPWQFEDESMGDMIGVTIEST